MIRYALKCDADHQFESWFQSADAFQSLEKASMIECPQCGSKKVEKSLMAPRVATSRKRATPQPEAPSQPVVSAPDAKMEEAMRALKEHVEANSDYVGKDFAREATSMHLGDVPER